MVGLFLSEAILLIAAGLIGFAIGWRGHELIAGARRREEERAVDRLRSALSDAQVRRARAP
jgi:hypothetical protein